MKFTAELIELILNVTHINVLQWPSEFSLNINWSILLYYSVDLNTKHKLLEDVYAHLHAIFLLQQISSLFIKYLDTNTIWKKKRNSI